MECFIQGLVGCWLGFACDDFGFLTAATAGEFGLDREQSWVEVRLFKIEVVGKGGVVQIHADSVLGNCTIGNVFGHRFDAGLVDLSYGSHRAFTGNFQFDGGDVSRH